MNTVFRYIIGALSPASAAALVATAGVAASSSNPCPEDCDKQCCEAQEVCVISSIGGAAPLPRAGHDGVSLVLTANAQPEGDVKVEQRTFVKIIQKDDTGEYELIIEDGKPEAKVDGKVVSKERVKKVSEGVWVVHDSDGEPLATFHVGGAPAGIALWSGDSDLRLDVTPQMRLQLQPPDMQLPGQISVLGQIEQPKTMLGVVMGEPPAALVEHFEIKGGKAILLDDVIKGLPASKAGLRSGDIIIKVEGSEEATAEAVRKALREKDPGDELKVQVLRQGGKKSFVVKLEAFDGSRLGRAPALIEEFELAPDRRFVWMSPGANQWSGLSAETRKQMEHALQALKGAEALASGEAKRAQEQARQAIEQFVKALEQMEEEGVTTGEAMRGDLGRWFHQFGDNQMVLGDKPGMVFTLPRQNFAFRSQSGDDVEVEVETDESQPEQIRMTDDVDARLKALSDRLERIEKLLEKLADDN